MDLRTWLGAGALGLVAFAAVAKADDVADVRKEVDALKRKVRELEGASMTQDEIDAAVGRYFQGAPQAMLVGGADEGKAGWPMGKKPFIKEGPNKLEFAFRNQVRYEAFLYSDHAKGTLSDTGNPYSDAAPRDRSGFEIERLYVGFDGTVFCEDISFKMELNFDADNGTGVEKNYLWLDWKYAGEHHVRAGSDMTAYSYEEQNSSSSLAFVDRNIVTKGFQLGFDTGVELWGYFGSCDAPKNFQYKFMVSNGEGDVHRGSTFNTDAFDTYADNPLLSGYLEWNVTKEDWKWDEVDNRSCDKRCHLNASLALAGYYEDDEDVTRTNWGNLAVRGKGKAERWGLNAWFRAQYNGWSTVAEWYLRNIDYTGGSDSPTQQDMGAEVFLHYRFADSNWGIGARFGIIWLDSDYDSVTVGPQGNTKTIAFADTITEVGVVLNYFFYDHNNKVSLGVDWIQDNSGVSSSSQGSLVDPKKGVVVEDGLMLMVQWQLNF